MGLDLYSGTLSRYYAGDWQPTAIRWLREQGVDAQVFWQDGRPPWLSKQDAVDTSLHFKRKLREILDGQLPTPLDWNEDPSTPYHTTKPDHDGLRALVLHAAYLKRPDLVRPDRIVPIGEPDPAYDEALPKKYYLGAMAVFEAQVIVPSEVSFFFLVEAPLAAEVAVTSTKALRDSLAVVNETSWKADERTIASWMERGPLWSEGKLTVDRDVPPGHPPRVVRVPRPLTPEPDPLNHAAQYAFACFTEVLAFSERHATPILQDS